MKKSKDKIEKLFRSYFWDSKKVNQPAGWNVPSEEVWDNIQKVLVKEKKPQRKFVYWHWVAAAASVLFLISIFQLHQSKQQIQVLSKQLAKNDQAVQKIESALQALNNKREKEGQNSLAELKNPHITETNQQENANTQNSKTNVTKEITVFNTVNAVNPKFPMKLVPPTSPNSSLGEVSIKDNEELATLVRLKKETNTGKDLNRPSTSENTFAAIGILNKLPTLISNLEIPNQNIKLNSPIIPTFKRRPIFYVGMDYSPVWTTLKNKGFQFGRHEFFPKREVQETAYTIGLQFGIQRNNGWSLETGLRYNSINMTISHNKMIPYAILQERLNNQGYYESNVNLQLGSSGGAVDTDVSLARAVSTSVDEAVNINMDIAFTNDIHNLDIPLIVRKEWAVGSLALSIKAGLLNRFLLAKKFELQEINIDDSRFSPTSTAIRERSSKPSDTNYAAYYLAGLGLEYKMRSPFSLYVEPTFIRSMQPVIGFRGASIYTQSKMVNIGLRYQL